MYLVIGFAFAVAMKWLGIEDFEMRDRYGVRMGVTSPGTVIVATLIWPIFLMFLPFIELAKILTFVFDRVTPRRDDEAR